jgi:putative colanic acid biosynthesis acetyltransferase WcaF
VTRLSIPESGTSPVSAACDSAKASAAAPIDQVRVGPRDCPSPHALSTQVLRVLWGLCWLCAFRTSPWFVYGWRRFLLRAFGARVGRGAKILPSTRIWAPWNLTLGDYACLSHDVDCYCVARVTIGAHATVSQYSYLCAATHDVADPHMRLVTAPITIADQAWVCARVFIGPGVTIGQGAVAGACSVVIKDVPPWTIVCGNPACHLRDRRLRLSASSSRSPDTDNSP